MVDMSESTLWREACDNKHDARQRFAAHYLPIVRRFLATKVEADVSQDIAHQTFERLFDGVLQRYQGRSKLSSFVLGVA